MVDEKRLITVAEAAKLENISERAMRMRIDSNNVKAEQYKCASGVPGGKQWLIDFGGSSSALHCNMVFYLLPTIYKSIHQRLNGNNGRLAVRCRLILPATPPHVVAAFFESMYKLHKIKELKSVFFYAKTS
ncbi:MAG: hypothetical protein LBO03_04535 [Acidaminococcales bacterium]|jgi:hypothetical protein|nr:hypothetical protein [Acidaminococcales bacterium]